MSTVLFTAENVDLEVYNEKAIINYVFDDTFTFIGASSYFLNVYDERSGRELKTFTSQVTRTSTDTIILNLSVSDCTFEDIGTYYYEMGYIRSGGYEEILTYGNFIVI